ncbi:hypothetical protein D9758_010738 [Tetrapyrgos nigripes]|uniref:Uncharacterized protein n=1 Tax=Tetrapyrgos nigripes TaxID=182062 RepID=A0A8H5D7X1_9AGAR|nr:hypothetical protein D9758_010738 [Tetrapyrgos nigripes]
MFTTSGLFTIPQNTSLRPPSFPADKHKTHKLAEACAIVAKLPIKKFLKLNKKIDEKNVERREKKLAVAIGEVILREGEVLLDTASLWSIPEEEFLKIKNNPEIFECVKNDLPGRWHSCIVEARAAEKAERTEKSDGTVNSDWMVARDVEEVPRAPDSFLDIKFPKELLISANFDYIPLGIFKSKHLCILQATTASISPKTVYTNEGKSTEKIKIWDMAVILKMLGIKSNNFKGCNMYMEFHEAMENYIKFVVSWASEKDTSKHTHFIFHHSGFFKNPDYYKYYQFWKGTEKKLQEERRTQHFEYDLATYWEKMQECRSNWKLVQTLSSLNGNTSGCAGTSSHPYGGAERSNSYLKKVTNSIHTLVTDLLSGVDSLVKSSKTRRNQRSFAFVGTSLVLKVGGIKTKKVVKDVIRTTPALSVGSPTTMPSLGSAIADPTTLPTDFFPIPVPDITENTPLVEGSDDFLALSFSPDPLPYADLYSSIHPHLCPPIADPDHIALYNKILTPYNANTFEQELASHSLTNKFPFLVRNLREGFLIGQLPPISKMVIMPNDSTCRTGEGARVVEEYIQGELDAGRFSGPFTWEETETRMRGPFISSPLIVASSVQGLDLLPKYHFCCNLSKTVPEHASINSFIEKADFPTKFDTAAIVADMVVLASPPSPTLLLPSRIVPTSQTSSIAPTASTQVSSTSEVFEHSSINHIMRPPVDPSHLAQRRPRTENQIAPSDLCPTILAKHRIVDWETPWSLCQKATSQELKDKLISKSIVEDTKETYGAGLACFIQFCDKHGVDEELQMLADPTLVTAFLGEHMGSVSGSTASNWLSGLKARHDTKGAPWCGNERWIQLGRRAMHKEGAHQKRDPHSPITIRHRIVLRKALDFSIPFHVAIWAVTVITFWACRHLGETTVPSIPRLTLFGVPVTSSSQHLSVGALLGLGVPGIETP